MEKIPDHTFKDVKKHLPPAHKVFTYGIAAILLVSFSVLFVANPSITGTSVVESPASDTARFAGTSSILVIIFAVFALFIFLVTKKLRLRQD